MSGNVGSDISESGMVANVGAAVEIASPSISVQNLFLIPILVDVILSSGCRPMSGHVASAIAESGGVENVGEAAETASKSISVQKLFLLPVSTSGFVTDI